MWSWCVFGVCVWCAVCVLRHAAKKWKNPSVWIPTRLRVYIQNVSMYAGTSRTCVSTCARCRYTRVRFECTHGGVFEYTHEGGRRQRKAHVEFSLGPREVHQRNPWIIHIFKFEKTSRTTCPRFLRSAALPAKTVQFPLS